LKFPDSIRSHNVLHVSTLKAYHTQESEIPKPPPILVNEIEEFEVEKILDARVHRRKQQYLVKWLGYETYDSTWEPEENVANAASAIKDFWDEQDIKDGRM
jgi:Chromo (CHRromatin Organisation MOdifier) domain